MTEFLNRLKQPTEDGQKVVDWMQGMIREADETRNVDMLNAMPGYMKFYHANVMKLKAISPNEWLEQFENTGVASAWRDMTHLEEQAKQAEKVEETIAGVSTLEASLEQVKEELASQRKEIKTLKSAKTKLTNKLAALQESDETEAEAEGDTDDSDDEPEAEDETADAETEDDADDSDPAEDVDDKEA